MTAPSDGATRSARSVIVTTSYPASPGDPSGHFVAAEVAARRARGECVTVLAPRVAETTGGVFASNGGGADTNGGEELDVRRLPAHGAFGWPGALARLRERPLRLLGVARFVLAARRELARLGEADRVVAHFIVPCGWPIAARRGGRALEIVAHGSDVRLLARLPAPLRRHIARRLAGADVRCASEELRRTLAEALGPLAGSKLRSEPPALALPCLRTRAEARAEVGLGAHERVIVVVGRLVAGKRVEVALGAARLIPHARTIVVGDGPERAELERRFPNARFVGLVTRTEALAWITAADVLLSASVREGAPSVVREARATGTPVVALAAGDLAAWAERDPGLCVVAGRP